jgi:hypothetical protein
VEIEIIKLKEIRQTEEEKCHMFFLIDGNYTLKINDRNVIWEILGWEQARAGRIKGECMEGEYYSSTFYTCIKIQILN